MAATIRIFISLLLISHISKAGGWCWFGAQSLTKHRQSSSTEPQNGRQTQKPSDDSFYTSVVMVINVSPLSFISLLLLGLTVIMSGSVYCWVLRYVCIGCCQPVVIGPESQTLAGMV